MKVFCWLALALAVGVCAGCKPDESVRDGVAASTRLFKEGKGVLFSEESKKLLGVETEEVEEKPVERSIERSAQVYRAGKGGASAGAVSLIRPAEARDLKAGQPVLLRGSAGSELTGELVLLDGQAEAALGGIEAVIEFNDPDGIVTLGTFLSATFNQSKTTLSLLVPRTALLTGAEGDSVYTVNGTHLTRTRVKAGMTCGDKVEIRDGLYAGDLVAKKGVESLWAVELSALKGGTPCCPAPKK